MNDEERIPSTVNKKCKQFKKKELNRFPKDSKEYPIGFLCYHVTGEIEDCIAADYEVEALERITYFGENVVKDVVLAKTHKRDDDTFDVSCHFEAYVVIPIPTRDYATPEKPMKRSVRRKHSGTKIFRR